MTSIESSTKPAIRAILLNGPPGCGKDTIGDALASAITNRYGKDPESRSIAADTFKFAEVLKRKAGWLFPQIDSFEREKDDPTKGIDGVTRRRILIQLSEGFFKPLFGQGCFGSMCADSIRGHARASRASSYVAIVTDCGFKEEAREIVSAFGPDNVMLVRIQRRGCTFADDSRSHVRCFDIGLEPRQEVQIINWYGDVETLRCVIDKELYLNTYGIGRFVSFLDRSAA